MATARRIAMAATPSELITKVELSGSTCKSATTSCHQPMSRSVCTISRTTPTDFKWSNPWIRCASTTETTLNRATSTPTHMRSPAMTTGRWLAALSASASTTLRQKNSQLFANRPRKMDRKSSVRKRPPICSLTSKQLRVLPLPAAPTQARSPSPRLSRKACMR